MHDQTLAERHSTACWGCGPGCSMCIEHENLQLAMKTIIEIGNGT